MAEPAAPADPDPKPKEPGGSETPNPTANEETKTPAAPGGEAHTALLPVTALAKSEEQPTADPPNKEAHEDKAKPDNGEDGKDPQPAPEPPKPNATEHADDTEKPPENAEEGGLKVEKKASKAPSKPNVADANDTQKHPENVEDQELKVEKKASKACSKPNAADVPHGGEKEDTPKVNVEKSPSKPKSVDKATIDIKEEKALRKPSKPSTSENVDVAEVNNGAKEDRPTKARSKPRAGDKTTHDEEALVTKDTKKKDKKEGIARSPSKPKSGDRTVIDEEESKDHKAPKARSKPKIGEKTTIDEEEAVTKDAQKPRKKSENEKNKKKTKRTSSKPKDVDATVVDDIDAGRKKTAKSPMKTKGDNGKTCVDDDLPKKKRSKQTQSTDETHVDDQEDPPKAKVAKSPSKPKHRDRDKTVIDDDDGNRKKRPSKSPAKQLTVDHTVIDDDECPKISSMKTQATTDDEEKKKAKKPRSLSKANRKEKEAGTVVDEKTLDVESDAKDAKTPVKPASERPVPAVPKPRGARRRRMSTETIDDPCDWALGTLYKPPPPVVKPKNQRSFFHFLLGKNETPPAPAPKPAETELSSFATTRLKKGPVDAASPEGLGLRLKHAFNKPFPKDDTLSRLTRKARSKIECSGYNTHLLKEGDDTVTSSPKVGKKLEMRDEDAAATVLQIQDVVRKDLVLVTTNRNNGGKLFVANRPFWCAPIAEGEDTTSEEKAIASSVVVAVAKEGKKLAEPPEEEICIDPWVSVKEMQVKDKGWFDKDVVFGNTVRNIISCMTVDMDAPLTTRPGPEYPHIILPSRPPSIEKQYHFEAFTHKFYPVPAPYKRTNRGTRPIRLQNKNDKKPPSPLMRRGSARLS
ncbi:unnamed protein product, partial [Mesorhabditis spiculigera]